MYYPVGWPRQLRLPQSSPTSPIRISANRDRILMASITLDSIIIWYAKPCVPIISHRLVRANTHLYPKILININR